MKSVLGLLFVFLQVSPNCALAKSAGGSEPMNVICSGNIGEEKFSYLILAEKQNVAGILQGHKDLIGGFSLELSDKEICTRFCYEMRTTELRLNQKAEFSSSNILINDISIFNSLPDYHFPKLRGKINGKEFFANCKYQEL